MQKLMLITALFVVLLTAACGQDSGSDNNNENGASSGGADLVAQGEAIFNTPQYACANCHAIDTDGVGPKLGGLYNSQVALRSGETVTADVDYLRRSIIDPDAQVTAGYPPGVMAPYDDRLSDAQIDALVAYIQSLE